MKKKTLSILLALTLCVSLAVPVFCADSPSSWAAGQVNAAIGFGFVPQHLQSDYTRPITRAEFCALAVTLYEDTIGEIRGRKTFADTSDINAEKAAALGIVSGVGNGRFDPNGNLTREQAAVMLVQLAEALGKTLERQPASFADNDSIAPWAIERVGQVQAAEVMSGTGNNMFSPKGLYTREQSIVTVLRLSYAAGPDVELDFYDEDITDERLAEMIANGEISANVTRLYLGGNSISDLSLLSNLTRLTCLDVSYNDIRNISPLRNLTNLTELYLGGNEVHDISPLGSLANLTRLFLWGNSIKDITPLGNLTKLEMLEYSMHHEFNGDLSPLKNLANLTSLSISAHFIPNRIDFSPIGELANLESLGLTGVGQPLDISFLSGLTNLNNLGISSADISDFTPLGNLPNLEYFDSQNCSIRDVSPFAGLTNLIILTLWHNEITDVTPLFGLTSLVGLGLSGNPLTEEQIDELRDALPNCEIWFDTFDDIW
jgi:hypothetical protein